MFDWISRLLTGLSLQLVLAVFNSIQNLSSKTRTFILCWKQHQKDKSKKKLRRRDETEENKPHQKWMSPAAGQKYLTLASKPVRNFSSFDLASTVAPSPTEAACTTWSQDTGRGREQVRLLVVFLSVASFLTAQLFTGILLHKSCCCQESCNFSFALPVCTHQWRLLGSPCRLRSPEE